MNRNRNSAVLNDVGDRTLYGDLQTPHRELPPREGMATRGAEKPRSENSASPAQLLTAACVIKRISLVRITGNSRDANGYQKRYRSGTRFWVGLAKIGRPQWNHQPITSEDDCANAAKSPAWNRSAQYPARVNGGSPHRGSNDRLDPKNALYVRTAASVAESLIVNQKFTAGFIGL